MTPQLSQFVVTAIEQQNALLSEPIDLSNGEDTPLYGEDGQIDSLTLVSILVDVEAMIRETYGIETRLADTSDLPSSSTPYATFGSLVAFVQSRCETLSSDVQIES